MPLHAITEGGSGPWASAPTAGRERPGHAPQFHPLGTVALEQGRQSPARLAGGHHIVHHGQPQAGDGPAQAEGVAQVVPAGRCIQPLLGRGGPVASDGGQHRQIEVPAQPVRQLGGLVEAALPAPSPVHRHREQDIHLGSIRQALGQQLGQAAAHGQSTAILEGRQQQGDGLAVPQGAGAALPGWWSPLAEPAAPSPRKGQSAAGAGCPHPGQFLETGRTQPTLPNGASAGHALQGPGEGAQPPGDVNHFSSSRLTAGVAQLPWPRSRDTHGSGVTSCSQESIRVICHHPSPRLEPGRSAGAVSAALQRPDPSGPRHSPPGLRSQRDPGQYIVVHQDGGLSRGLCILPAIEPLPDRAGRRAADGGGAGAGRCAPSPGYRLYPLLHGCGLRSPKPRDMPVLLAMVEGVRELGMETCMTLGMLTDEQAGQLAAAGLDYYNHNLDTSPEFYGHIITTRTYQDRLATLARVRQAGIKVCAGGIVGMGENLADRAALLCQLASLPEHPESVPINLLVKVAGTPLAETEDLDPLEFVRTVAVARILMPHSRVRLSAGREDMDDAVQALCFFAGANSMFYGERLLTTPNPEASRDQALLQRLGMRVEGAPEGETMEPPPLRPAPFNDAMVSAEH